jgi:hypothetical protein
MTETPSTRTRWTDADFESLCWHDCVIHSLALDHDGEYQSDLVLDLDFILEWILRDDNSYEFRVAPCLLRFQGVSSLQIRVSLGFKEPMEIDWIERSPKRDECFEHYHWNITLHRFGYDGDNAIQFDAMGFAQELTGNPTVTQAQFLLGSERERLKDELRKAIGTAAPSANGA